MPSFRFGWRSVLLFAVVSASAAAACGQRNGVSVVGPPGPVAPDPAGVRRASPAGLFGYAASNAFFTRSVGAQMGAPLAQIQEDADWHWATIARFDVGAHQYLMFHGRQSATGLANDWSVRELFTTGDLGNPTDSGTWSGYYRTLVGCQSGGSTYLIGQRESDNHWFVRRVGAGGVIGDIVDRGAWPQFFGVAAPMAAGNHAYVYFQSANASYIHHRLGYAWFIAELTPDGQLQQTDSGYWDNYYPSTTACAPGGQWFVLAHRPPRGGAAGPWFVRQIDNNGTIGPQTAAGAWNGYFPTLTAYRGSDGNTYLFGQNTNKRWFVRRVLPGGTFGAQTDGGVWTDMHQFVAPFAFDALYLHADDWMAALAATIGPRQLSAIALPGSHDAGVNALDFNIANCQRGASSCNTTAQNTDIKGQLALGSRYFDIRPMMTDVEDWTTWRTGHYQTSLLMGCRGEAMSAVFDDVNAFFADSAHAHELAILKFSHCFNLKNAADCAAAEFGELTAQIESGLAHLVKCDNDCDLMSLTLDQILEMGNVIALVDGAASDKPHGIFAWDVDVRIYDNYSNTDDLSTMVNDQSAKLTTAANHDHQLFLLSWTLTQSTLDAVECIFSGQSILGMAAAAHDALFGDIHQWVEAGSIDATLFPNIIYIDAFDSLGARTALYLNRAAFKSSAPQTVR